MQKTILPILLILILSMHSYAQPCSSTSLITRSIKANATDNNINWELLNHQVFINPNCTPNNKLLIHLVGTFGSPASTTFFPSLAANNGYKVIVLKYPNNISGTSACRTSSDFNCHLKYRQEIIFGTDSSSAVTVDSNNAIVNRVQKLLIHLDGLYPSENWGNFLTPASEINWSNVVASGHSQGGGHAAFLGKKFQLDRVLMFASPNEYSTFFSAPASWINNTSTTADSNHYAFLNLYDEIVDFSEQYLMLNTMNLNAYGDTILIENKNCPYKNSRMLYTTDTSATGTARFHGSVIIDDNTPLLAGEPIFTPVWKYMLGICNFPTSISDIKPIKSNIEIFPNPTHDFVKVKSSEQINKIEVLNTLGEKEETFIPNDKEYKINISQYHGLHFIRVYTRTNKSSIHKIIAN